MLKYLAILVLGVIALAVAAGAAVGLWQNPNTPKQVEAACQLVAQLEAQHDQAAARGWGREPNLSYDYLLRAAPGPVRPESLKGVNLPDRARIASLELKRRIHAEAYDQPLDCSAAFQARRFPRDPGSQAREALARKHPLRSATVVSSARPVIGSDGWMLIRRTEFVCVAGHRLHRPSTPDTHTQARRLEGGTWRPVGDYSRTLLYRVLPLDRCPTP